MKKVCGLDVHKDNIFCAIYNGNEYSEVKEFTTATPAVHSMGEYLQSEDVEEIALESTGIYWVAVWDLLYEKEYNPLLVPVQDPVKMKARMVYHKKEYEKTAKLLNVTA